MVLLCHTLPDGSSHYDWLIERPGTPANFTPSLAAFRVMVRIDDPACAAFDAHALPDHRRIYLTFEGTLDRGPVGEPRGAVKRLASGWARLVIRDQDAMLQVTGAFEPHAPACWIGRVTSQGCWRFERQTD
jgi:hypothetical protein